jgi:UDP-GlcNAc:undecaprenyl-phosphate GlcNAc-1-phosphate transferase
MISALVFTVALVLSLSVTPRIRDGARRLRLLDHGSGRKVHVQPVPRLGGLAVALGFFAAAGLALGLRPDAWSRTDVAILGGAGLAALLGVVDDLRGVGAKTKLLCQLAIAFGVYAAGVRIEIISVAGMGVDLGVLGQPLTVLWIVGVMNALNLIDGLDGLAGSLALIALGGALLLSLSSGQDDLMLLAVAAAGAVLGFLAYNREPASIFMGDGGSLLLGFLLAVLTLRAAARPGDGQVAMATPVLFLAVPLFDTATAFFRRLVRGASPFSADRQHVHHRLLQRLGSHRAAVRTLGAFALVFTSVGLLAAGDVDVLMSAALLTVVLGTGALLVRTCGPAMATVAAEATPAPVAEPDEGAKIISIELKRQQRAAQLRSTDAPDPLRDSWPPLDGGLSARSGRGRSRGGAGR